MWFRRRPKFLAITTRDGNTHTYDYAADSVVEMHIEQTRVVGGTFFRSRVYAVTILFNDGAKIRVHNVSSSQARKLRSWLSSRRT